MLKKGCDIYFSPLFVEQHRAASVVLNFSVWILSRYTISSALYTEHIRAKPIILNTFAQILFRCTTSFVLYADHSKVNLYSSAWNADTSWLVWSQPASNADHLLDLFHRFAYIAGQEGCNIRYFLFCVQNSGLRSLFSSCSKTKFLRLSLEIRYNCS